MKLDRTDMVKFTNFFIDTLRNTRRIRSNNAEIQVNVRERFEIKMHTYSKQLFPINPKKKTTDDIVVLTFIYMN